MALPQRAWAIWVSSMVASRGNVKAMGGVFAFRPFVELGDVGLKWAIGSAYWLVNWST